MPYEGIGVHVDLERLVEAVLVIIGFPSQQEILFFPESLHSENLFSLPIDSKLVFEVQFSLSHSPFPHQ